jgi:hypothetical protein
VTRDAQDAFRTIRSSARNRALVRCMRGIGPMGTHRLVACQSCGRHVRIAELACPFCESPLPPNLAKAIRAPAPGLHLSRAALYAFGATSLTLAAACSRAEGEKTSAAVGTVTLEAGQDQGVRSTADGGGAEADQGGDDEATVAMYGGPPPDQAK